MSSRLVAAIGLALLAFGTLGTGPSEARFAAAAPLFTRVAGTWAGAGSLEIAGSPPERIRCEVVYTSAKVSQLHLGLRCATDSFTLQVASDLVREGNAVTGSWVEQRFGFSGEVSGVAGSDNLRVTFGALGSSAQLAMTLRGSRQSISVVAQGQLPGRAMLVLRRL